MEVKSKVLEAKKRADAQIEKEMVAGKWTISEGAARWQELFWQAMDELRDRPLPNGWEEIKS